MVVAYEILTNKSELRGAVNRLLHLERKVSLVRIITMSFGDFELSSSICDRLIKIHRKGDADVTLVFNEEHWDRMKAKDKGLLQRLSKSKIIHVFARPRLHAKLILVIGEKGDDSGALLTSANFTQNGMYKLEEIGVIFDGQGHKDVYKKLMEFTNNILSIKATIPLSKFIESRRGTP